MPWPCPAPRAALFTSSAQTQLGASQGTQAKSLSTTPAWKGTRGLEGRTLTLETNALAQSIPFTTSFLPSALLTRGSQHSLRQNLLKHPTYRSAVLGTTSETRGRPLSPDLIGHLPVTPLVSKSTLFSALSFLRTLVGSSSSYWSGHCPELLWGMLRPPPSERFVVGIQGSEGIW